MDFFWAAILFIASAVFLIFILILVVIVKIYSGKSIGNPNYPPVQGTVFHLLFNFNKLYDYLTEIARKHPTFRVLSPDQSDVYTTDVRNIQHILKTKFDTYTKGKYDRDILEDLSGEGIFAVDGDKWRQQRKIASFEFSARVLRDFSCAVFRISAAKLVRIISANYIFDIHIVKEDILSRFIEASKKEPDQMTDQYLRDIILNFMIAGKDSTANTVSWFIYMLCKNPLIQEKIFQEVKEYIIDTDDEINIDDFVDRISDEILDKMHYLHSALTETLRLYPGVPVDGRTTQEDDVLPDGYKVKKGETVNYLAYTMGRMPYIWGDDADEFRPERWLDQNGVFQQESPFKFIAFHAGPRICLGKDFAYRQMKIVSIALLRLFRFRLGDETRKVTYRTMFTLHVDGGLHVQALPRVAMC
ncbi:cytochrome P450 704C1 isoform X3 [Spinacia oleracea]|uniref:Cytochrome P450 704C1 isoform X3 n=1 Tax=Spinacia oleracea TaxID=3562 RepID=A0ABM3RD33_SPIOL|nr:cytochrome P450 704C1-like isoform X3 [Spinacia oleracea]